MVHTMPIRSDCLRGFGKSNIPLRPNVQTERGQWKSGAAFTMHSRLRLRHRHDQPARNDGRNVALALPPLNAFSHVRCAALRCHAAPKLQKLKLYAYLKACNKTATECNTSEVYLHISAHICTYPHISRYICNVLYRARNMEGTPSIPTLRHMRHQPRVWSVTFPAVINRSVSTSAEMVLSLTDSLHKCHLYRRCSARTFTSP
jgi:hypothetical protein